MSAAEVPVSPRVGRPPLNETKTQARMRIDATKDQVAALVRQADAKNPQPPELKANTKFQNEQENAAEALLLAKQKFAYYGEDLAGLMKLTTVELTAFIFGVQPLARWKTSKHDAREIWEHISPNDQCQQGVGLEPGHPCWICGFPIDTTKDVYGDPGRAECEHVLPIAQAVPILALYTAEYVDRDAQKVYQLEYDWAHSHCNQIKNDDVYVEFGEGGAMRFRDDYFMNLMEKLLTKSQHKELGDEFREHKLKVWIAGKYGPGTRGQKMWKDARKVIFQKKFEDIATHVTDALLRNGRELGLLLLASNIHRTAENIRDPKKRQILGLGPLVVVPPTVPADDSVSRIPPTASRAGPTTAVAPVASPTLRPKAKRGGKTRRRRSTTRRKKSKAA